MAKRSRSRATQGTREETQDRVPLARLKGRLSQYVRAVQTEGRTITITLHGRPAAILAPAAPQLGLRVREPVDPRPLGALRLRPPRGQGASAEAIRRAWERA